MSERCDVVMGILYGILLVFMVVMLIRDNQVYTPPPEHCPQEAPQ